MRFSKRSGERNSCSARRHCIVNSTMAGRETDMYDSPLRSEVLFSDYEEFFRTSGLDYGVSDTVNEEYFDDQTCLQNSQVVIHNEQLQHNLMSEVNCTEDLGAQNVQYCSLNTMSPCVKKSTSSMPPTNECGGQYCFNIKVDSSGRNVMYSSILNKLFITVNTVIFVGFKNSSVASDVYVRALLIYSELQHFKEPVVRCLYHKHPDLELNKGVNEMLIDYVMHTDDSKAVYEKDPTSGRHSVRVHLDRPEAGAEWVMVPYKFMCKSSCYGINRRLTEVIFTLENESGDVLGSCKMKVKICSYPKRDKDREESCAEKNQNQTLSGRKRKLASSPERQNKQAAKQEIDGFPQQIFPSIEEFLNATALTEFSLKRKIFAEKREPTERERMLLQKYHRDLELRHEE